MPQRRNLRRRMRWTVPAVLVVLVVLAAGCAHRAPSPAVPATGETEVALSTIAFGSCARQDLPQPVWDRILARDPDLMLLLGDNIYTDVTDRGALDAEYARLAAQPGFAALRARVPLLATWDDHDYGLNDGGRHNPLRAMYEAAFLDFFDVASSSPRRRREGIYDSRVFGPPGRRVQIVLLDLRSFRDDLIRNPKGESTEWGRYVPNEDPTATMLGDAQWRWLEGVLQEPADLRVLVSSIQVVADGHGWEKWGNLPHERRRLFRALRAAGGGVLIVSGDRHLAELSMLPADDPEGVGYPLYDFTASGLTHGTSLENEPNRYRVGAGRYTDPNFGLLRVDWDAGTLRFQAIAVEDGGVVVDHEVPLAALAP